jgi:magnesium and cobalt transporter
MSQKNTEVFSNPPPPSENQAAPRFSFKGISWLRGFNKRPKPETLRNAIEEYIDEPPPSVVADPVSAQEKLLLSNILKLRDIKVYDVMIPRADIVAIDVKTTSDELLSLLAEKQFSRIPVYRDTLDDVLGTVHLKDIMAATAKGEKVDIKKMLNEIPIVSPTLHVLDLLLEMRENRRHMVLAVDEYGGINGLVTIGDVIESIVGQMEDEHDTDAAPQIVEKEDGSILADARYDIEEFEERFGYHLSDQEREDSDTLGGLVFSMAGRIPARGEVITHKTGMVFEVLDADPRRINLLRIRNIPEPADAIGP